LLGLRIGLRLLGNTLREGDIGGGKGGRALLALGLRRRGLGRDLIQLRQTLQNIGNGLIKLRSFCSESNENVTGHKISHDYLPLSLDITTYLGYVMY
jgi:hypothetical protein